jgi:3-dehydrosphinganine reductase
MTQLNGARVVVTGGSEGIGLEVARLLVQRGAQVTIVSRSEAKLAAAKAQIGDVATLSADVTTLEELPPCDVLVASAGGAEPGHFLELSADQLRRQLDLNYLGAVNAVRAVLPGMLAAGKGHVVLLSSVAGLTGVFGYGGYGPAKAALRNLAEVLEAEYADRGITVAVAYPPDTLTPGFARENLTKPAEKAAVSAKIKPVPPEQVARAVVAGIEKDHRTITADVGSAAMARAGSVLGPAVRASMRRTVRKVRPAG